MKSELKFIGPSWRITITIGILMFALIVFISIWFTPLFMIGGGVIIALIAGYGAIVIYSKYKHLRYWLTEKDIDISSKTLDLKIKAFQADKMEFERYILSFPKTQRIVMSPRSDVRLIEAVAEVQPALLPVTTQEELSPLLDVIGNEPAVIFRGAKRSGKTNSALWWLSMQGQAVVCDPKNEGATINHWPDNCIVVSTQADITRAINSVENEMHKRRKSGLVNEASITLFFDEIHDLITRLDIDVLGAALNIATLGSEFGIFSAFTTHANTGRYLKIDAIALLENFVLVRTSKMGDVYKVYVDLGEGEIEVQSPGKYLPPTIPPQWPDLQTIALLTESEMIEQAILNGDSNNKICIDVWGSKNSERIAKINAIREGVKVVQ